MKLLGVLIAATMVSGSAAKRMADGKQWTTQNLKINIPGSYCYGDEERNCGKYGRLYTWDAARQGCEALGKGWRLPTEEEWRELALQYGGTSADSDGKAAYRTLMRGGHAGFEAVLGGRRSEDREYSRLEAHGFYWTATETHAAGVWFYNFGRGGLALHRQDGGGKNMGLSVRCVRE